MSLYTTLERLVERLSGLFRGQSPVGRPATGKHLHVVAAGHGPAWGTLSGLTAHPSDPTRLFAINDNNTAPIRIFEIRVSARGAEVVRQIVVRAPGIEKLDPEGIAARPGGGFWLAAEGGKRNDPPNGLLEVDENGDLMRALHLPATIAARISKKGFEGVARFEVRGQELIATAFQAPIAGDPGDTARIALVDPVTGDWTFVLYPLSQNNDGETTGLSDLLHIDGLRFAAIERDGSAKKSSIKWITLVDLASVTPSDAGGIPPRVSKRFVCDLVPIFVDAGRKPAREIEGLARAADGKVYVVTDNDGDGDTFLLQLGQSDDLF